MRCRLARLEASTGGSRMHSAALVACCLWMRMDRLQGFVQARAEQIAHGKNSTVLRTHVDSMLISCLELICSRSVFGRDQLTHALTLWGRSNLSTESPRSYIRQPPEHKRAIRYFHRKPS